jgi:hypothetical protein
MIRQLEFIAISALIVTLIFLMIIVVQRTRGPLQLRPTPAPVGVLFEREI